FSHRSTLISYLRQSVNIFFFFNDPSTTEIYTLSLHDALPILPGDQGVHRQLLPARLRERGTRPGDRGGHALRRRRSGRDLADHADRKSTRLNSSHVAISYAVFCLKKKK